MGIVLFAGWVNEEDESVREANGELEPGHGDPKCVVSHVPTFLSLRKVRQDFFSSWTAAHLHSWHAGETFPQFT